MMHEVYEDLRWPDDGRFLKFGNFLVGEIRIHDPVKETWSGWASFGERLENLVGIFDTADDAKKAVEDQWWDTL